MSQPTHDSSAYRQNGDSHGQRREPDPDGRTNAKPNPKFLNDYVDWDKEPLINGEAVGVNNDLVRLAEAAGKAPLPKYPPQSDIIDSDADNLSDEAISDHVRDRMLTHPIISAGLQAAKLLNQNCESRKQRLSGILDRLEQIRDRLPLTITASDRDRELPDGKKFAFWSTWAGVAVVLLSAWLVFSVFVENFFQISSFMAGTWGLTQTFAGAFGVTWTFTLSVIVITRTRRSIQQGADADEIMKKIAKVGFTCAWIGLAGLGLMMGVLHAGDPGDWFLMKAFRCALTVASVLTLAVCCVALEWGVEIFFKKAYQATQVPNAELAHYEEQMEEPANKLMAINQLIELSQQVESRIVKHIRSQYLAWFTYRNACRDKNARARKVAAAQQSVKLAELNLESLSE